MRDSTSLGRCGNTTANLEQRNNDRYISPAQAALFMISVKLQSDVSIYSLDEWPLGQLLNPSFSAALSFCVQMPTSTRTQIADQSAAYLPTVCCAIDSGDVSGWHRAKAFGRGLPTMFFNPVVISKAAKTLSARPSHPVFNSQNFLRSCIVHGTRLDA